MEKLYKIIDNMDIKSDSFVYAISCVDSNGLVDYRYVGITTRGILRFKEHIRHARYPTHKYYNSHKSCWIRKNNFNIKFEILEYCSSYEELCISEIKWIKSFKDSGYHLTNYTEGGLGAVGYNAPKTDEHKKKLSESMKGQTYHVHVQWHINRNLCKLGCNYCGGPVSYLDKDIDIDSIKYKELFFPKKRRITENKECVCGVLIHYSSEKCRKCYYLDQKAKADGKYPPTEEIIHNIEKMGYLAYSKILGISDNGIRKRLRSVGVDPLPKKKN